MFLRKLDVSSVPRISQVVEDASGAGGAALSADLKYLADRTTVHTAAAERTADSDGDAAKPESQRFQVGSRWLNTATRRLFVCIDNSTDAAQWTDIAEVKADASPQLGGDLDLSDGTTNHKIFTSQANGDVILEPNGNGALRADSAGYARGDIATDLQRWRLTSDKVTAGIGSVICGGYNIHAKSQYATITGGANNVAEGIAAMVGGGRGNVSVGGHSAISGGYQKIIRNQADMTTVVSCGHIGGGTGNRLGKDAAAAEHTYPVIPGGEGNVVEASYASIGGGYRAKASLYGQQAQAGGQFAAAGDAQTSVLVARKATTSATP